MSEVKQQGQYWMLVDADGFLYPSDGVGAASTTGTFLQGVRESVISHVVVTAVSGASASIINFRRQNAIPGTDDSINLFRFGLPIAAGLVVPHTIRFGHSGAWFGPGASEEKAEADPEDLDFLGEGGMWTVERAGAGSASLNFIVFFNIIS